jgi:hypothetical protein
LGFSIQLSEGGIMLSSSIRVPVLGVFLTLLFVVSSANAAVMIDLQEVFVDGSGLGVASRWSVTAEMTGSLDLTDAEEVIGYTPTADHITMAEAGGGVNPAAGGLEMTIDRLSTGLRYLSVDAFPLHFGPGGITIFTGPTSPPPDIGLISLEDTAGSISLSPGVLGLPADYISGAPILASMTFAANTLEGLGITPGSVVWTLPSTRSPS